MVSCREPRDLCSARSERPASLPRREGGPVFLPPRRPSRLARELLAAAGSSEPRTAPAPPALSRQLSTSA